MELRKQDIDRISKFVEGKYVDYYDVQVELVDHIATAIEEKQAVDPGKEFEEALEEVYRSFGVMGFADLVMTKEDAMAKQRMQMWWHECKTWFAWPKVALTVLILLAVYFLAEAGYARHLIYGFQFWMLSLFGYYCLHLWKVKREYRPENKKQRLLLLQSGMLYGMLTVPVLMPFITGAFKMFSYDFAQPVDTPSWYLALLMGLITIVYLAFVQVEKTIFAKAKELYPEMFPVIAYANVR